VFGGLRAERAEKKEDPARLLPREICAGSLLLSSNVPEDKTAHLGPNTHGQLLELSDIPLPENDNAA
jgi:hypothetical protein